MGLITQVLMVDLAVAVQAMVRAGAAAAAAVIPAVELIRIKMVAAVADPISRIQLQIPAVLPVKMKVMVRSSLPIVPVSALPLLP